MVILKQRSAILERYSTIMESVNEIWTRARRSRRSPDRRDRGVNQTETLPTSRGASTTDVMLAGNWKTSRMVAHYSAGATAERGAVARYL